MVEKTFNIPLRKAFLKGPWTKKTNKAIKAVRDYISQHMKSDNVKIGKTLNQEIWKNVIKNPPHHVKVTALKDNDGKVIVEKFGVKIELEKPKKKEKVDETPMGKIKEALKEKKEEKAVKSGPTAGSKIEAVSAKKVEEPKKISTPKIEVPKVKKEVKAAPATPKIEKEVKKDA